MATIEQVASALGPVSWYRFAEGALDQDSVASRHGTTLGAPSHSADSPYPGGPGSAMDFASSLFSFPLSIGPTVGGSFSISWWMRASNLTNLQIPLGFGNASFVFAGGADAPYEAYFSASGESNSFVLFHPLPSDAWVHIVLVWDKANSTHSVYRDGVVAATQPLNDGPGVWPYMRVGSQSVGSAQHMRPGGLMAEIMPFDKVLTAEEVGYLHDPSTFAGPPPPTPTPPSNTTAPVAGGTPDVGEVLTVTNGSWSNSPSSYSYEWRMADSADPLAISSAAGSTINEITVTEAHEGKYLLCRVTAANADGSGLANSNMLGPVPGGDIDPDPDPPPRRAHPRQRAARARNYRRYVRGR